ncbi:hypothetical protein [Candidatus Nitrosocosmicus hydrocola]|uniref:hypothetical protein n=1 Tax=Candidatus Nitrosocosmicus hydrocola TaxID=1826872 RepID=UPI0011E5FB79|nr:hypothetical protein [Candidatus Nitrosocosmicus hydrocola]
MKNHTGDDDNTIKSQSGSKQPEIEHIQLRGTSKSVSSNPKGFQQKKRTIYYPKSFGSSDASDGSKNRNSNDDTQIIEPPEFEKKDDQSINDQSKKSRNDLLKRFFPDILKAIGNKAIKESPPTLQELEVYLQQYLSNLQKTDGSSFKDGNWGDRPNSDKKSNQNNVTNALTQNTQTVHASSLNSLTSQKGRKFGIEFRDTDMADNRLPIVAELIKKGYLTDSDRWLNKKGFVKMGEQILVEIIKSLKADKLGMHETKFTGYGSIIQETSRRFEHGNEIANININSTIRNFIERLCDMDKKSNEISIRKKIEFPLDITYEDIEVYDTLEEIQVSTVYCIDLSSTMKYSSMYNELSRIEASKRALWSLYILNKKFFPLDIIHTIGFGSIATRIDAIDIPFLRTFEPNADFLHYTNYQSAYRLAKKILRKDGVKNKRIVMITDGHPSACYIDEKNERDRILRQRPYSHFYKPDPKRIGTQNSENNRVRFDIHESQTVYLCYRYRQIDQYIGEQTIMDAKKLKKDGIDIDTIMVSEEDTLLDFVNELAKSVDGKSIYINPRDIDKVLITDYLSNKKKMIKS